MFLKAVIKQIIRYRLRTDTDGRNIGSLLDSPMAVPKLASMQAGGPSLKADSCISNAL